MNADRRPWSCALAALVLVAGICNGATFYLKRTGFIDADAYRLYWTAHCHDEQVAAEWQCAAYTSPREISEWLHLQLPEPESQYVFSVSAQQRWLKLMKDAVWSAMLVASLAFAAAAWARPGRLAGLTFTFGAGTILAAVHAWVTQGAMIAAAGLRANGFPWLALAGRGWVGHLGPFAVAIALLLIVQLAAAPVELVRGIHLFGEWPGIGAKRLAGTLNQPNSLGVYAVTAWAFCFAFLRHRRWLIALGVVAVALVLLSGSATGLVCIALAVAWSVQRERRVLARHTVLATAVVLVGIAVVLMPQLTGRLDVFESLGDGGRAGAMVDTLTRSSLPQLLFGRGLGVGTNTALGLGVLTQAPLSEWRLPGAPSDSQLIGLVIQLGFVGAALFYALLWRAAIADPRARPFYAALGICSLTSNVLEVFPVNLMLGLALAHSIWSGTAPSSDDG